MMCVHDGAISTKTVQCEWLGVFQLL